MNWYRLDATADLDEQLLEDCWRLCRDLSCSDEATQPRCAVFERPSGDTRTIFFPPAVGLFAQKLGAQRCQKPAPDGLILVHGDAAAWRAHFGGMDGAPSSSFETTFHLSL
jgi:hypothetical protein